MIEISQLYQNYKDNPTRIFMLFLISQPHYSYPYLKRQIPLPKLPYASKETNLLVDSFHQNTPTQIFRPTNQDFFSSTPNSAKTGQPKKRTSLFISSRVSRQPIIKLKRNAHTIQNTALFSPSKVVHLPKLQTKKKK